MEEIMSGYLTYNDCFALAYRAHLHKKDKLGAPYFEHVRIVGDALAKIDALLGMAGLFHDTIEDTSWTAERLRAARVHPVVVSWVVMVTNVRGETYKEKIKKIAKSANAALIKSADNAHNSLESRLAQLDPETAARLRDKYSEARKILWPACDPEELRIVIEAINPELARTIPAEPRS
jgi:(p)ppGpp synthase/HD superfamily hydrolase